MRVFCIGTLSAVSLSACCLPLSMVQDLCFVVIDWADPGFWEGHILVHSGLLS